MKKIFFATPIAGYGNNEAMLIYKKEIITLIQKLKESYEVFAEIAVVRDINDFDTPAESAMIDFKAIEESEIFVLHYPKRIPTSALIELGYAFGKAKKIIIIVPERKILPSLAQELDIFYEKAKIFIHEEINIETTQIIFQEICETITN